MSGNKRVKCHKSKLKLLVNHAFMDICLTSSIYLTKFQWEEHSVCIGNTRHATKYFLIIVESLKVTIMYSVSLENTNVDFLTGILDIWEIVKRLLKCHEFVKVEHLNRHIV